MLNQKPIAALPSHSLNMEKSKVQRVLAPLLKIGPRLIFVLHESVASLEYDRNAKQYLKSDK